jgi:filamentous hemagglutinin family protein
MQNSWKYSIAMAIATLLYSAVAQARPVADETLGNERTIVTPDVEIRGRVSDRIDGGARRGSNLFHSFRAFNIEEGRSVYFNDPGVENILGRVTGNSHSEILGRLGVLGNANLFLINPNGILFGANASLDVSGSFVTSTAESLVFANYRFSAVNPSAPPLLTLNVPIGLQVGANPGGILVQGSGHNLSSAQVTGGSNRRDRPVGLQVGTGQTLALVGGELAIEGGNLTAAGGQIELGSVAGDSLVKITPARSGWSLGYEGVNQFQNIRLTQAASADSSGNGGGSIQVQGRHVTINEGSQLLALTLGSQAGRNLTVNASDEIQVSGETPDGSTPSRLTTRTRGSGTAGNLTLTTRRLVIEGGAQVSTPSSASATGDAGALTVSADEVRISGASRDGDVLSRLTTRTEGAGDAGDLRITTRRLVIEGGAEVSSSTLPPDGTGNAGNLTIYASDKVRVSGGLINSEEPSRLTARTAGTGNAGTLTIDTSKLVIDGGAQVSTATFSSGRGGAIVVNADSIHIDGLFINGRGEEIVSRIGTRSESRGTEDAETLRGDAGNLTIRTRRLVIERGGEVSTSTFTAGKGGRLTITALDEVRVSGISAVEEIPSGIVAQTKGAGTAGDLTLTAGRLVVQDGAEVSASTERTGNAGDLTVQAQSIEVIGSNPVNDATTGLFASTLPGSTGNAGSLTIATDRLHLANGGRVVVNSAGLGRAGDINISARMVQLDDRGRITAETRSVDGGNVNLRDLDFLLMRDQSDISTSAQAIVLNSTGSRGGSDGGNIAIDADFIVAPANGNSDIRANAYRGNGGRVEINSQGLFGIAAQDQPTDRSDITASSERGVQGTVEITTPDTDPERGTVELPTTLVDRSDQIAQACPTGEEAIDLSKFVITGRGGLPPDLNEILNGDAVQVDLVTRDARSRSIPELAAAAPPIVEAQGWIRDTSGSVRLVGSSSQPFFAFRQCG